MKFLVPINLNKNEIRNAAIQNLANSDGLTSPATGQIYFNTTNKELMIYSGTAWEVIGKEYTAGTGLSLVGQEFSLAAHNHTWSQITDKPITFAPSAHTHQVSEVSDATTIGQNLVKLTNPSAIRFLRINADNTVSALSAADFRGAIGAGTSSTVGTVTSVALSAPTGFEVSGTPITASGTLALSFATGYSLPTTAKQSNWDTAYGWGNHAGLYRPVSWVPGWTDITDKPGTFTPASHTHGSITNDGKIGTTNDLVVVTGVGGALTTASRSGIDSRSTFPAAQHSIASHSATAWRMFYSNATTTAVQELAFGAAGTYLRSAGPNAAPTFAKIAYSELSGVPSLTQLHNQNTDEGTSSTTFYIGTSGPKVKNASGEIQLRNNADSEYADLRVKNLYVEGTEFVTKAETIEVADNTILLNSNITTKAQNEDGGIDVKRFNTAGVRKDASFVYDNSINRWEATFGEVEATQVTAIVAAKLNATVGDGTNTSFVITHNLNTRDLQIAIRENAANYELVYADVEMTTVNTITVKFATAPTASQYNVTIIG